MLFRSGTIRIRTTRLPELPHKQEVDDTFYFFDFLIDFFDFLVDFFDFLVDFFDFLTVFFDFFADFLLPN